MARATYGYYRSPGNKLIPEPTEQNILKEIRALRDEGYSFRDMAAILKERGIKTRDGYDWHYQRIEIVCNQKKIISPICFRPSNTVREYLVKFTRDGVSDVINKLVEKHIQRRKNNGTE